MSLFIKFFILFINFLLVLSQVDYLKKAKLRKIATKINDWKQKDKANVWELSGQFEGDIKPPKKAKKAKNIIPDQWTRWPNGVIPYEIDEVNFSCHQISAIKSALEAFDRKHTKACVELRPRTNSDQNYIFITPQSAGCWSYVGMQGGAQHVNLQAPNCVTFDVIIHEVLHAFGMYHQQSAQNRDDYVRINWDNIPKGMEDNFEIKKSLDYGVEYDYQSIMHYSAYAFSKNNLPTIEPLRGNVRIGQREGFSPGDLTKLMKMYGECN